jgi:micrococcal nuclease
MRLALALCLALASCNSAMHSARAIDGDTFVADGIHYRLLDIDAPEMPGHCRPGRHCAPGDPYLSQHALQWLLNRDVNCTSYGLDYYGRTLVRCSTTEGMDIGRAMLDENFAIPYRRD